MTVADLQSRRQSQGKERRRKRSRDPSSTAKLELSLQEHERAGGSQQENDGGPFEQEREQVIARESMLRRFSHEIGIPPGLVRPIDAGQTFKVIPAEDVQRKRAGDGYLADPVVFAMLKMSVESPVRK